MAFVIAQATDKRQRDPFGKAVAQAIEVGVVVPSILRSSLQAAGFSIVEDDAALADYGFNSGKVLKRAIVTDKEGNIVAMGAAADQGEALAAAALGYFREHPLAGSDVPAGFATAPQA
jgi:hypothetical protein